MKKTQNKMYTIEQMKRMIMLCQYNTWKAKTSEYALISMLGFALMILRGNYDNERYESLKSQMEGMVKAYNEIYKKEL